MALMRMWGQVMAEALAVLELHHHKEIVGGWIHQWEHRHHEDSLQWHQPVLTAVLCELHAFGHQVCKAHWEHCMDS